jgi:hypothetical protein
MVGAEREGEKEGTAATSRRPFKPVRRWGRGPDAGCHAVSGERGPLARCRLRTAQLARPRPDSSAAHACAAQRPNRGTGGGGADVWASATVTGGGGLNLIRFQIQTDSNQVQIV